MIALVVFRVTAYLRSHRAFQALLPVLAVLAIVHGNSAPVGSEATALADSAVLVLPFLAWAARSVLDTEPDQQRVISATGAGGGAREVVAGLLAALTACVAFAALAFGWGLTLGLSALPSPAVTGAAATLHVLAALAGVVLGALTSRVIVPSPALSIMGLLAGYLAMLLVSASPLYWLTVPVTAWIKAATAGDLPARLPALATVSLVWCVAGLAAYAALRRTRP
ncbi:hypothetical protein ACWGH8_34185 [Nonomuraea muscovyensis]|uniref:Uncharacterized protein n=1 Tax=Nonomuraea muscovyensis TaxID=1124761 RepID=A0A7X0CB27_9ACTN|nr:hypothetical protein [Nonomuraea muscovyensis]MBB6351838.1 hypothetical protein [Nonomuraea muscovyensis]MDF2708822.1 hypothetical protein [Nonomuraea muscovyensis]